MNHLSKMYGLTGTAKPVRAAAGFTLVEVMIVVVVMAILVGTGLPSFVQMLRNAEIRNAAETIVSGIQRARAEAVARNANMEFVLTGGSTSWKVDYVSKPVSTDPAIDQRTSSEGSAKVSITAIASVADGAVAATTVSFNNVGQVIANADASKSLSKITLTATGGNQTLWVTVGAGGNARACDPSLTTGSSPRAC